MELVLGREIKKAREILQQSQEALAFEAGIIALTKYFRKASACRHGDIRKVAAQQQQV